MYLFKRSFAFLFTVSVGFLLGKIAMVKVIRNHKQEGESSTALIPKFFYMFSYLYSSRWNMTF